MGEPEIPPADPALLATANRALHAEVEALRRQVAELQALGVSLHKASAEGYAIGEASERAAIVAWLKRCGFRSAGAAVERREHLS